MVPDFNEYIIFIWGTYKRPEHYSGYGSKCLHSECVKRVIKYRDYKIDMQIAIDRANELLAEFSQDHSLYISYEAVIKGDDGVEYYRL